MEKGKRKHIYHWFVLGGFVILLFVLHRFVLLYGDDYYHSTAASGNFQDFMNFHVNHYLRSNGRAIIHFLLTLCFYGPGVEIWKIISPIIFGMAAIFAAKAFTDNSRDFRLFLPLMCILMLCFGGKFTSYSIFTLTPVFNYLYPFLFVFPVAYYSKLSYESRGTLWGLPILGFFAGATMEQTGIMTIGYIVLIAFVKLIMLKKRPRGILIVTFFTTLLGYLTVILAPGNFVRMETSTNPFMENFVAAFTMLINQKTFVVFNFFLIFALCYWLLTIRTKSRILRVFNIFVSCGLAIGYCVNVLLIFNAFGLDFTSGGIFGLVWRAFDLGYIFAMIYVPICITIEKKTFEYIIHMIIALGSIFILFFASVSEYRPLTPALIILNIFISLTLLDMRDRYPLRTKQVVTLFACLSLFTYFCGLHGFYGNYIIANENEHRIKRYIELGNYDEPLYLMSVVDEETAGYSINLPNKRYIYPLPENSDLLDGYSLTFKEYYSIPKEVEIIVE